MYQATGRYSSSTKYLVPADLVTPIPPRMLASAVSCQRGVRGKEEKTTPPLYTYSSICLIQGVADSTYFLRHEMTPWSSERPKRLRINSALNYFHEITLFLAVPYRAPPLKGATGPWLASFGWPAVIWRPHSVGPRSGLAWLAQLGWLGLGLASFS